MSQTAADAMSRNIITVSPSMALSELYRRLSVHHQDGACVVEKGALVGVVTPMDVVLTLVVLMDPVVPMNLDPDTLDTFSKVSSTTVADLMSSAPITVRADTPLADVAAKMIDHHFSFLPVVCDDGSILGAVTRASMLRSIGSPLLE